MHPGIDHLAPALRRYRAFLNPSTSDVVATTSAEALAMGRWLVVPRHPCNAFFAGFAGCLIYGDAAEFHAVMAAALASPPPALTPEEARALTWQAATERFLEVSEGPVDAALGRGVRRSPSEDAGFASDGGLGGGLPLTHSLADLPRGGSGAASAAALSALAPGGEEDGLCVTSPPALGAGPGASATQPPPSALSHAHCGAMDGAAAASATASCPASPPPSRSLGVPRSASTLAFAPTPSPEKSRFNPASRLVGRAKAALGGLAYRAFEAASGVEAVRRAMGAGAFTRDAPPAPPGAFDPTDRAALAAATVGRGAAADAHARLGYPRPRYIG